MKKRICVLIGTRPDALKMIPIYKQLKKKPNLSLQLISTGQHQELLHQVLKHFGIVPDMDFKLMRYGQSLSQLTADILVHLEKYFNTMRPDLVLAHGDTTSCYAAALSCFYQKIPFYHVEAGLRSHHFLSPYPEEFYRKTIAQIATHHFSPTTSEKNNLLAEGICEDKISVIGHTIHDAIKEVIHSSDTQVPLFNMLADKKYKKMVIVTLHRRELGVEFLKNVMASIKNVALQAHECLFISPVHPNPIVRQASNDAFQSIKNVVLTEPLQHRDFLYLLKKSDLILTDSGGIQEEASYFGKNIFILRERTERLDGINQGLCRVIGINPQLIESEVLQFLQAPQVAINHAEIINKQSASKLVADFVEKEMAS